MSTCISREGEYSAHVPDREFYCARCGVFDEEAVLAELALARESLDRVRAICDKPEDFRGNGSDYNRALDVIRAALPAAPSGPPKEGNGHD